MVWLLASFFVIAILSLNQLNLKLFVRNLIELWNFLMVMHKSWDQIRVARYFDWRGVVFGWITMACPKKILLKKQRVWVWVWVGWMWDFTKWFTTSAISKSCNTTNSTFLLSKNNEVWRFSLKPQGWRWLWPQNKVVLNNGLLSGRTTGWSDLRFFLLLSLDGSTVVTGHWQRGYETDLKRSRRVVSNSAGATEECFKLGKLSKWNVGLFKRNEMG